MELLPHLDVIIRVQLQIGLEVIHDDVIPQQPRIEELIFALFAGVSALVVPRLDHAVVLVVVVHGITLQERLADGIADFG